MWLLSASELLVAVPSVKWSSTLASIRWLVQQPTDYHLSLLFSLFLVVLTGRELVEQSTSQISFSLPLFARSLSLLFHFSRDFWGCVEGWEGDRRNARGQHGHICTFPDIKPLPSRLRVVMCLVSHKRYVRRLPVRAVRWKKKKERSKRNKKILPRFVLIFLSYMEGRGEASRKIKFNWPLKEPSWRPQLPANHFQINDKYKFSYVCASVCLRECFCVSVHLWKKK